ncbi:5-formyltetrahydrofolate cyclo-ligase [Allostella humosa]|uniref:5-formyltetrahydrofolate cyclo-ligase n=1 Tax=Stella humosa TaxID=94 RepID=UPI0030B816BF
MSPSADRDTDLEHEKATFRVAATLRRSDAARHAGPDAGDRLADRFLAAIPAVTPETVVSGYFPIGEEMDPRPLMARLAAAGCTLCLPVTPRRGLPLTFRQWRPGDPLRARPFGLSEPLPEAPAAEPDLLLVPLLAFDAAGRRMGYGGGFYDRTLAGLRARRTVRAIGVAFDGQFCDRVPAGPHDARLDAIVTEAAFYPAAAAGD